MTDTYIGEAKTHRVLKMIIYLSKWRRTSKELSERFNVSERTISRYLELIDALDLGLEQGFGKKYFIVPGKCPVCGQKHSV